MFGIHNQESFQFSISEAICLLNGSEGRGGEDLQEGKGENVG